MILPAQVIRHFSAMGLINPYCERTISPSGKSYGLSSAGYDIRVDKFKVEGFPDLQDRVRMQAGDFVLASSLERIKMPPHLIAIVHDKSSWAREGLAIQNTVLEPGWEGYITLELSFHRPATAVVIKQGDPIAQLIFHLLSEPTEQPYGGKYQHQPAEPVESIDEPQK
jgi:dCTP deaminase